MELVAAAVQADTVLWPTVWRFKCWICHKDMCEVMSFVMSEVVYTLEIKLRSALQWTTKPFVWVFSQQLTCSPQDFFTILEYQVRFLNITFIKATRDINNARFIQRPHRVIKCWHVVSAHLKFNPFGINHRTWWLKISVFMRVLTDTQIFQI